VCVCVTKEARVCECVCERETERECVCVEEEKKERRMEGEGGWRVYHIAIASRHILVKPPYTRQCVYACICVCESVCVHVRRKSEG